MAWNMSITPLFGGASRGISLDDEDLGKFGVALRTVGELAGQRRGLEGALAPGQLARLARRLAGSGGIETLGNDASWRPPGVLRR